MDELSKQLKIALTELALEKNSKEFSVPFEGLRLRSLYTENEKEILLKNLDMLKAEKFLSVYNMDKDFLSFSISPDISIPSITQSERNIVIDRAIMRALLFRLYQEYRNRNSTLAKYPLAELSGVPEFNLEVQRREQLLRLVF